MSEEKGVKIIPFNSVDDNWYMWSMHYLATAVMIDIDEIYTEDADVTKMGNDQLRDHRKKVKKIYGMLVIACQDKVSFSLVKYSKSRDFP